MPPKAKGEAAAAVLLPDTNPYGVFVNIEVPSVRLTFEQPTDEHGQPIATTLPTTHLAVTYPGPFPPLSGEPTQPDAASSGHYAHNLSQKFRREPGLDSLNALLNAPTTICLHDSTTGALLASAPLDLTPFGLGQTTVTLADFLLDLAAVSAAAAAPEPTAKPGSKPATPQGGKKGAAAVEAPPAAPLPPTAKLLGPPVLPSITLHLTQRPAPQEPLESAQPAATAGAAAEQNSRAPSQPGTPPAPGSARSATATAAVSSLGSETAASLPDPTPYSFLPDGDAATANVITLELIEGPASLPPGLMAASTAAPGKLSLTAALVLPPGAGAPLVLPGVPLLAAADAAAGQAVAWPNGGRLRRVMTGAEVQALVDVLDGALPGEAVVGVEVTRTMAEDKALGDTQVAWDAYHAWAPLPGMSLLLEGGEATVPAAGAQAAALVAWPTERASVLPAFVPPAGKVKPIEDVASGSGSAWQTAGSALSVRVAFARPPVPEWSPPSPPSPSLQELVPQRVLHPPAPPPTADQDLSTTLTSLVTSLAGAYKQHCDAQLQGQVPAPAVGVPPEVAHKALIRDLNKSGRYLAWRDSLKAPLVRLVREQLGKSGHMTSAEMVGSLSALHAQLMGAANTAVRTAADDRPKPPPATPPAPPPAELESLALLASEAEEVEGDWRRAAALMQRRRLDGNNMQVHLDAAQLACRSAHALGPPALANASAALHAALEIDPTHAPTLATAAALHTAQALTPATSAEPTAATPSQSAVASALAAGHALLALDRSDPTPWALLYCAYTAAGDTASAVACMFELKRQQRATLRAAAAVCTAAPGDLPTEVEKGVDQSSTTPLPPAPVAILLPAWRLSVQLGLAPLAFNLMQIATTRFSRTTVKEPVAAALLTARTALLLARATPLPSDAAQPSASPADPPPGENGKTSVHHATDPSDPIAMLDMAAAAAKRARRAIRASPTTLVLDASSDDNSGALRAAQLARLQLTPALLLGEVEWERARRATAAADVPAASRQQYLARRAEARRATQHHKSEGRRAIQETLQMLSDQGWMGTVPTLVTNASTQRPVGAAQALFGCTEAAEGPALAVAAGEGELKRGLLRLAVSYLEDEPLPECALDVATAAVALWPDSVCCWSAAACAAAASADPATRERMAHVAWAQANLCDRWDGRAWEALALHEFRWGAYEDGLSAMQHALALAQSAAYDPAGSLAVAPSDPLSLLQEAARRCTAVGKYQEAARHLATAISLSGGDTCFQVRHQLAGVSACLGDSTAARQQAAAAFTLASTPMQHQQARELLSELAVV